MSFKDQLASDLDIFFNLDEFAEPVEYTSRDAGTTATVRAIIDYGNAPGDDRAGASSVQATAQVILSELPAAPRNGDLFVVDGISWSVVRRMNGDSQVATLQLRRDARNRFAK